VIGFISYPLKFNFKILVKFYDLRKALKFTRGFARAARLNFAAIARLKYTFIVEIRHRISATLFKFSSPRKAGERKRRLHD